jgi:hypothetical protein
MKLLSKGPPPLKGTKSSSNHLPGSYGNPGSLAAGRGGGVGQNAGAQIFRTTLAFQWSTVPDTALGGLRSIPGTWEVVTLRVGDPPAPVAGSARDLPIVLEVHPTAIETGDLRGMRSQLPPQPSWIFWRFWRF